jgi:hypothetical protein
MTNILIAACLVFLFMSTANAQTSARLADKYPHHEVYEVQPGVQMTPKFDSHRMVCEMRVEPTHFRDNGADFAEGVDEHNVHAVIDQLVPVTERGVDMGTSEDCAGVCMTTHEYSNVLVKILSGGDTRLMIIKWRNRSCV